jgi:hypothetical protein
VANDTFEGLAGKVLLRCPSAGPLLARDWIRNSWRDLVKRRAWSWKYRSANVQMPAQYNTGTASITVGNNTVTLVGTTALAAWVGMQFRVGNNSPILTIDGAVDGDTTFTLDQPWYGVNVVNSSYTIYQAYYELASDLDMILSVIDPRNQYPVAHLGYTRESLDERDPQRAAGGAPPKCIVPYDFKNGSPRWELWPHQYTAGFLSIWYLARPIDAFDSGAVIPSTIDGDVILERALSYCARWPGSSRENPNPYYSDVNARYHNDLYEQRVAILMAEDNNFMQQDVRYRSTGRGFSIPSAAWAQQHAW